MNKNVISGFCLIFALFGVLMPAVLCLFISGTDHATQCVQKDQTLSLTVRTVSPLYSSLCTAKVNYQLPVKTLCLAAEVSVHCRAAEVDSEICCPAEFEAAVTPQTQTLFTRLAARSCCWLWSTSSSFFLVIVHILSIVSPVMPFLHSLSLRWITCAREQKPRLHIQWCVSGTQLCS